MEKLLQRGGTFSIAAVLAAAAVVAVQQHNGGGGSSSSLLVLQWWRLDGTMAVAEALWRQLRLVVGDARCSLVHNGNLEEELHSVVNIIEEKAE
jgi:hypothetical protein